MMKTLAKVGVTSNSLWWAINGVGLLFAAANAAQRCARAHIQTWFCCPGPEHAWYKWLNGSRNSETWFLEDKIPISGMIKWKRSQHATQFDRPCKTTCFWWVKETLKDAQECDLGLFKFVGYFHSGDDRLRNKFVRAHKWVWARKSGESL